MTDGALLYVVASFVTAVIQVLSEPLVKGIWIGEPIPVGMWLALPYLPSVFGISVLLLILLFRLLNISIFEYKNISI